jgi:hypothetical protein
MAQIDWELIRKRMILLGYQVGTKNGFEPVPPDPCEGWILFSGSWDDSNTWQDECTWEDGNIVAIYSQVVEFDTPMNSIQYRCDGEWVAASYGQNRTDLDSLVAMFNQLPPVSLPWSNFLDYGVCYNNGDGRVRMDMYQSAYDALACTGSLTLDVIYD